MSSASPTTWEATASPSETNIPDLSDAVLIGILSILALGAVAIAFGSYMLVVLCCG